MGAPWGVRCSARGTRAKKCCVDTGVTEHGLLHQCVKIAFDGKASRVCQSPETSHPAWQATTALVVIGAMALGCAVVLTLASYRRASYLTRGRWLSFAAGVGTCCALGVWCVEGVVRPCFWVWGGSFDCRRGNLLIIPLGGRVGSHFVFHGDPCVSHRLFQRTPRRQGTSPRWTCALLQQCFFRFMWSFSDQAFKLPEETSVGAAFIIFVTSLLFVFIGELFSLKLLCPPAN